MAGECEPPIVTTKSRRTICALQAFLHYEFDKNEK